LLLINISPKSPRNGKNDAHNGLSENQFSVNFFNGKQVFMIKRYVIKVSHDHTGSFSLKAIVPDNASYDTVIFLFNKTISFFF